jgi:hypothetical protein
LSDPALQRAHGQPAAVVVVEPPPNRPPKPFGRSDAHFANAVFSAGVVVVVDGAVPAAAPGRPAAMVTPLIFKQLR